MKQKIEYYVIKNTPITESLEKIESSKNVFNRSDKAFEEWQLNFKKATESGDIKCDKGVYEAMFANGYAGESEGVRGQVSNNLSKSVYENFIGNKEVRHDNKKR